MADVSGKGVPAALFMMAAKIILQSHAKLGETPAQILANANEAVCARNDAEMFVTVWLGILELSTGRLTAANAGHEFPIFKDENGTFEVFRDQHGFVLGGMEGMTYNEYEIQLKKGGMLFLYTDGVPEATNTEEVLFGEKRLVETLNKTNTSDPKELLTAVAASIDEFVGEADQFDDLTMLGVVLK
jgi:sigma-B regulation protein RsbU (phosphoserine phosphatase)